VVQAKLSPSSSVISDFMEEWSRLGTSKTLDITLCAYLTAESRLVLSNEVIGG